MIAAAAAVIIGGGVRPLGPAVNPDPNHTHADFAVWIEDTKVDFARPEFMSVEGQNPKAKFFHLHDGNGEVMHSHKPGQPIGDFFASLGMEMTVTCFRLDPDNAACNNPDGRTWKMFVNGVEKPFDPRYSFQDLDRILLTYGSNEVQIQQQLADLTDESCLYSKTCPERGDPPTENCVADPAVPCMME